MQKCKKKKKRTDEAAPEKCTLTFLRGEKKQLRCFPDSFFFSLSLRAKGRVLCLAPGTWETSETKSLSGSLTALPRLHTDLAGRMLYHVCADIA